MNFQMNNEAEFFNLIEKLCVKNNIEAPNSTAIHRNKGVDGRTIVELSDLFLNRLKAANEDDYSILLGEYASK